MNESQTRLLHIDPVLKGTGWGDIPGSRIRPDCPITLGRLEALESEEKPYPPITFLDTETPSWL